MKNKALIWIGVVIALCLVILVGFKFSEYNEKRKKEARLQAELEAFNDREMPDFTPIN